MKFKVKDGWAHVGRYWSLRRFPEWSDKNKVKVIYPVHAVKIHSCYRNDDHRSERNQKIKKRIEAAWAICERRFGPIPLRTCTDAGLDYVIVNPDLTIKEIVPHDGRTAKYVDPYFPSYPRRREPVSHTQVTVYDSNSEDEEET